MAIVGAPGEVRCCFGGPPEAWTFHLHDLVLTAPLPDWHHHPYCMGDRKIQQYVLPVRAGRRASTPEGVAGPVALAAT